MSALAITVLYPQPTDPEKFAADYIEHTKMLHEKTGIPMDARPYAVHRFQPGPEGPAPFYQMFTLPFETAEALQAALSSPGMQEVAADAHRISSGGAPLIMVGAQTNVLG